MQDVVSDTDGGSLLRVEISPGADEDAFPAGYNPWRESVKARVRAPPEDGEANRALVGLVAEHLGVAASEVWIASGRTSRRKTLGIRGLSVDDVRKRLAEVLEG